MANDLFLNGLDCVIGDAQLRGERLFCQASAQAEYPPLIYFRYVTPRLHRALPPVTRRTPAVRA
jgi:hypothetical protein